MTLRDRLTWTLACLACVAILVAPAIWNGFPLLQYDTGGYIASWYDGELHINRSVPYGLLLAAGHWPDFWPVLAVQSTLTVWVLALGLRAHGLGHRPWLLTGTIAALSVLTALPWLSSILLTDIFAGLGVLALYLLMLRDAALRPGERHGLVLLVAAAAATHSATMMVLLGLVLVATAVWLVDGKRIPAARLKRGVAALLLGALMVLSANWLVAGRICWTPGGMALSFGRMLQDGIVKRYLDDHCPDKTLRLCAYKDALPHDADDFFWGSEIFDKLGRFDALDDEMGRIARASITRYPALQLKSILAETAKQIAMVETGAGIVNSAWDTYFTIKDHTPSAEPAMKAARQQRDGISFTAINLVQVPVAWFAMALLPLVAGYALRRHGLTDIGELTAAMTLAILGNAAVFGIFATAHDRYGARIAWLAVFAAAVTLATLYERQTAAYSSGTDDSVPASPMG
ncbi:MAG: hypothetical protein K9G60_06455 [Pseudolabrys sp.]|nr:hypothetical protein [Pseudolabrys sp.]